MYSSFDVDILHDIAVSVALLLFWAFSSPLTLSSVAVVGEDEDEAGEDDEDEEDDEEGDDDDENERGEEERTIGGVEEEEEEEVWTDIEGPRATGTEERALVKKIIWLYSSESEKGVLRSEGR